MQINLPDEDVDFIMRVLHEQPLPYMKVAPIVARLTAAINAELLARQGPPVGERAETGGTDA